eukprot:TRINITY_DN7689_c0_g1_i3.p1 TRINITY_DN7689_c0_g1~~TRINITY_DN7689_c0_g1_i3.p1  ORF type:complete len:559 (+),score=161.87 TRINITY_DN7689_c0_g1_i3:102-1679(+)
MRSISYWQLLGVTNRETHAAKLLQVDDSIDALVDPHASMETGLLRAVSHPQRQQELIQFSDQDRAQFINWLDVVIQAIAKESRHPFNERTKFLAQIYLDFCVIAMRPETCRWLCNQGFIGFEEQVRSKVGEKVIDRLWKDIWLSCLICGLLAIKMEEQKPPSLSFVVTLLQNKYTISQLRESETAVLKLIGSVACIRTVWDMLRVWVQVISNYVVQVASGRYVSLLRLSEYCMLMGPHEPDPVIMGQPLQVPSALELPEALASRPSAALRLLRRAGPQEPSDCPYTQLMYRSLACPLLPPAVVGSRWTKLIDSIPIDWEAVMSQVNMQHHAPTMHDVQLYRTEFLAYPPVVVALSCMIVGSIFSAGQHQNDTFLGILDEAAELARRADPWGTRVLKPPPPKELATAERHLASEFGPRCSQGDLRKVQQYCEAVAQRCAEMRDMPEHKKTIKALDTVNQQIRYEATLSGTGLMLLVCCQRMLQGALYERAQDQIRIAEAARAAQQPQAYDAAQDGQEDPPPPAPGG